MNSTLLRLLVLRQIRNAPGRAFLMMFGIALGVALYTAISLINRSTLASFKESIEAVTGKAALTVSAGETGFLEGTLDTLTKIPVVKHAVPMTENQTYFESRDGKFESLEVMGIDLLKESAVRTYKTTDEQVMDDPLTFLNQPDSVILTHEFADRHHLKTDDKIRLSTALGMKMLTVRGLLSATGPAKAFGGNVAIMDIDGARMTFGKEGKLDRVDLVLKEGVAPTDAAEKIRAVIGTAFQVIPPETQSDNMARMLSSFQGMLSFMSTLALMVGIFLVFNSVSVSVTERRREIGTVRALGGRRRLILGMVLLESAVVGVFAALLGVALGKWLAHLLLAQVVEGMSNQFTTHFEVNRIEFGWPDVIRGCIAGTVTTVLAAFLPAWHATRISAVEALRPKGIQENEGIGAGLQKLRGWFGLAGLIYLTVDCFAGMTKGIGWIEAINPPLSMIAAALVAPPLVIGMLRILRRLIGNQRGLVVRLALENLLRSPRRTSSNVLSLIVGLMLVVTIATVNASFRLTLLEWTGKVMSIGDMLVSQNGRVVQLQVQPVHEKLIAELDQIPGIDHSVNRFSRGLRYFKLSWQGLNLAVKAFDPPPGAGAHFPWIDAINPSSDESGSRLFYAAAPSTLVSENFVKKTGKKTGDRIEIETPTGRHTFQIVGVIRDFASPDGVLYFSRDVYKRLWKDNLVTAIAVSAAPGVDPAELKRNIENSVGKRYGVIAVLNTELVKQLVQIVDEGFAFNVAIQAAALLVGLVGLMNTMLISVIERTREIGLFRAVGMTRRQLGRMILFECFFQGAFGAMVAMILGGFISYLWIMGTLSNLLGWVIHFFFPLESAWRVFAAGLGVAIIAGVIPALRASRLEIRNALDYE